MTSIPSAAERFGVAFPPDLAAFLDLVGELEAAGLGLGDYPLGLTLAAPFARTKGRPRRGQAAADRYFNDPPEFVTVLHGDTDGLHWGYWFDDPGRLPPVVAAYYHNDAFQITEEGGDLLTALEARLADVRRTMEQYLTEDADNAATYRAAITRLDAIAEQVGRRPRPAPHPRAIAAPTREGMGIVVSPDHYRPIPGVERFEAWDYTPTEADVRQMAEAAHEALAAGFPGAALQLGRNLWAEPAFAPVAHDLLERAYTALDRPLLREWLARAVAFRVA